MRCDYHAHTIHSMDGHQSIDELCQGAIAAGLDEICVTEHAEPHHPAPNADIPPTKRLCTDIEAAQKKYPTLALKLGIEIGDFPMYHDEIVQWLSEWDLDYRLLSLHLVSDIMLDPFDKTYFDYYGGERRASYQAYASAVLNSLRSWRAEETDALAHLGYVGRYAPYPDDVKSFRWKDAPDTVDEILRLLAHNGQALEINTSSYRKTGEPTPGGDILRRFKELGGEFVMFGSDAHRSEFIAHSFDRAYELALDCGIRHTLSFDKRKRTVINIVDL